MTLQSSWLTSLLEMTRENESPEIFLYWSGLSTISAVVKKNVYLRRQYFNCYPNIYVMLVAKSGGKKGFPVKLAKKLVNKVDNTKVIGGQNSIQAVIQDLSRQWTSEKGVLKTGGEAFLCTEEFVTFLIEDDSALKVLTTLWDTDAHEEGFTKTLKAGGKEAIKDVCLTMLGASNETHLKDVIGPADITGGFLGRLLLVNSDGAPNKINSLIYAPKVNFDPDSLIPYLLELSKLKGEFKFGDNAAEVFDGWYTNLRSQESDDNTGTAQRIDTQVLKVAMLLSLSKSTNLIISEEDITEAIVECTNFISTAKRFSGGKGKNILASQTNEIVKFMLIQPNGGIFRDKLLREFLYNLDTFELDKIIATLLGMNIMNPPVMKMGGKVFYSLNAQFMETYKAKDIEVKKKRSITPIPEDSV